VVGWWIDDDGNGKDRYMADYTEEEKELLK
jgi:hypothetical protein